MDGKYFYINGSLKPRTRTFKIYIYEEDKTEKSWGFTYKYATHKQ